MRPPRLAVLAALALLTACAAPTANAPAHAATSVTGPLADAAWLAGHWVDASADDLSEEVWFEPAGNSMSGTWRWVSKGQLKVMELNALVVEGDSLRLLLRHFDGHGIAWEEKDAPLSLARVNRGAGELVFEGPEKGVNIRLIYRPLGADQLSVTLEKEGGGKPTRHEEFRFTRRR